jgi:predicted nucleic acid-binding protein
LILVIDTSVAISWIAQQDENNAYADAALEVFGTDMALVPGIWHWEMANTLLTLERKGRLDDAVATYAQVLRLPIDIERLAHPRGQRSISELELARKYRLSAYDAAYLALAKAVSHPLATLDERLACAARSERLFFDAFGPSAEN